MIKVESDKDKCKFEVSTQSDEQLLCEIVAIVKGLLSNEKTRDYLIDALNNEIEGMLCNDKNDTGNKSEK